MTLFLRRGSLSHTLRIFFQGSTSPKFGPLQGDRGMQQIFCQSNGRLTHLPMFQFSNRIKCLLLWIVSMFALDLYLITLVLRLGETLLIEQARDKPSEHCVPHSGTSDEVELHSLGLGSVAKRLMRQTEPTTYRQEPCVQRPMVMDPFWISQNLWQPNGQLQLLH